MKNTFCAIASIFLIVSVAFCDLAPIAQADSIVTNIDTGSGPRGLTTLGSKVFAAIYDENKVDIIDTQNNYAITTVNVGGAPDFQISLGTKVYTINTGDNGSNSVSIIDTANNNSVRNIGAGDFPVDIAKLGTKVYVTNGGDSNLYIIDTSNDDTTSTVDIVNSGGYLTTLGTKVYSVSTDVTVIDTANNNATSSIPLDIDAKDIIGLGTKLYVADGSDVYIVDLSNGNSVTSVDVGQSAGTYPVLATLNNKVYVTNSSDDTISVIDTLNGNAVSTIAVGDHPKTILAHNNKIYVANLADANVSIVDPSNGNSVTTLSTGATPYSMVGLDTKVYVANESGLSVTVIEGETTAPTVSSFTPTNDATDVSINTNLIINFSEDVDAESGTITIHKASDDSVVETIGVLDAKVSGSGTDTITINPTSDLETNTEYYIQIATNAFDDIPGNSYAGISDKTTWSFTTEAGASQNEDGNSGSSGGSSFQGRIRNLEAQGDPQKAIDLLREQLAKLIADYNASGDHLPFNPSAYIPSVRDLYIGLNGEDVRMLQNILIAHNAGPKALELARVGATGLFVNYTRDALVEYQTKYGIMPSEGYFGYITRAQMKTIGILGLWW